MSNKTLEQAIEEAAKEFSFNPPDYDSTAAYSFKYGAIWLSQNLHLLSPSDVAKIPAVQKLINMVQAYEIYFDGTNEGKHGVSQQIIRKDIRSVLSNFEPKKKEAE